MPKHVPTCRWGVLNDEIVIIHPSDSIGELEILNDETYVP